MIPNRLLAAKGFDRTLVVMFRLLPFLLLLGLGSSTAFAQTERSVLPLGDSITAGGKHFTCYREFLVPALAEHNIRFIGPNRDKTSAHAGYGGKNTGFLRNKIDAIYKAHRADIVLIHAGHNNFAKDKPVPRVIEDTEAIIKTIRKTNPKAVILLGQVITSGKLPKYSYIPELNRELATLAERLAKQGVDITLVDHATGFDWKTDTVPDKVHPNAAGAKKMADAWAKALVPKLK